MTLWVSLEGPNGVGKTHLARRLARRLGDDCMLLEEISDLRGDDLPTTLVGALAAGGDPFLRGEAPAARSLVLLALKTRAYERFLSREGPRPGVVLEDRGVDTVAAYQAAIIAGTEASDAELHREMDRIYRTSAAFRPTADLTLLVLDDPAECARRYALRTGRPMRPDERALSDRATRLYRHQAAAEPERFRVVNRWGLAEEDAVALMETTIAEAITRRKEAMTSWPTAT